MDQSLALAEPVQAEVIADRYVVESALGEGGMGAFSRCETSAAGVAWR
jgi:hypothetical protein